MQPRYVPVLCYVTALLLLGAAAAIVTLLWVVPNARLRDYDWVMHASPQALRENSERVLQLPRGQHHDACIYLASVGTPRSSEAIRSGLRWLALESPGGCAVEHCRRALREIAARNPGE
jgi:hypothetical protein